MYTPSARKKKKKKNQARSRALFGVALITLLLALGYVLALSPYAQIHNLVVEGNETLESRDITSSITRIMRDDTSVLRPQTSLLFFDNKSAENMLRQAYPEIQEVKVKNLFSKTITVTINERQESYVFCKEDFCYSVDKDGLIYRSVEKEKEEQQVFSSRRDLSIGDVLMVGSQLSGLSDLVDALSNENLDIVEINDYSPQTRALITNKGTIVLVPFSETYDETFSLLKKMLSTSPFRTSIDSKDFVTDYVYINAQFGKKIFSCVRGEICADNYTL